MKDLFGELGLGGGVFILVTLICLFVFNLSGVYSILIGVVGAGLSYAIKFLLEGGSL